MNRKNRFGFVGIAVAAVVGFAASGAASADDNQCKAAYAFVEMQTNAGVDIATYSRDEIQWLLAHQNLPSTCAAIPADLKTRMAGDYPTIKNSRRMNCHIALDFLFDASEKGKPVSGDERAWGNAYVVAAKAGEHCPEVPRGLVLRAMGHSIAHTEMSQFLATAMDKAGDGDAALEIALAYFFGTLASKDIQKGFDYLTAATRMGSPWAFVEMANMYRYGKVEGEPRSKALDYALKASATDNSVGHLLVADLYYTGDVVKKDHTKAVEYYLKAASRGELAGTLIAADLLFKGDGVKKDRKRALELMRSAAYAGDTKAMMLLVGMILQQKDLVKNKAEIWYWLKKSRDEGNAEAAVFMTQKGAELESLFVKAEYVPPKRECREILVCDVYSNRDGSQKSKICSTKRDLTTCDYSL